MMKGIYITTLIFLALIIATVVGIEKTKKGLDHSIQVVKEEKRLLDERWAKMVEKIPAVVTAYSSDINQTDDTPHETATGHLTRHGVIAVDPEVIPLGSMVFVPGYGWGVALDTGSKVKGKRIDVWMDSADKAKAWGKRVEVIIFVRPDQHSVWTKRTSRSARCRPRTSERVRSLPYC